MRLITSFFITASIMVTTSAGAQTQVPNDFTAGQPARAAEVNANFDALEAAVDDNAQVIATLAAQIASLEATVTALQASLAQVSNNSVLQLDGLMALDNSDVMRPAVIFTGVNVQIVNGGGETDTQTPNGVGNLLIGYDEARTTAPPPECSDGRYSNIVDCTTNSGIWALNHKTGSHNLVIGPYNNYSQTMSIVSGAGNTASGRFSVVLGATVNVAGGPGAVVIGGGNNQARNEFSVVVGGLLNSATGRSSIVSGGEQNVASGRSSSVNGGRQNAAVGDYSTVGGGLLRTAPSRDNWVAGGLIQSN